MKKAIASLLTLLWILGMSASTLAQKATMRVTVDNVLVKLFINEKEIKVDAGEAGDWTRASIVEFEVRKGKNVIAMHCTDAGVIAGLLADITYDKTYLVTDDTWKFSLKPDSGWERIKFDDSRWKNAVKYAQYPQGIWAKRVPVMDKPMTKAFWIWSDTNVQGGKIDTPVFFRFTFGELAVEPSDKLSITWGYLKVHR